MFVDVIRRLPLFWDARRLRREYIVIKCIQPKVQKTICAGWMFVPVFEPLLNFEVEAGFEPRELGNDRNTLPVSQPAVIYCKENRSM